MNWKIWIESWFYWQRMKYEWRIYMEDDYIEPSVCDDCEIGDGWECYFCCIKCYEDYGECPNPDCDPMDI